MYEYDDEYPRYVSAAERKEKSEKLIKKLQTSQNLNPIVVKAKSIATSFWGKSWCRHLSTYEYYTARLSRGRSYLRSGTVVDLQISEGLVQAQVLGTSLYQVNIRFENLDPELWSEFVQKTSGEIDSLLDLLAGNLPEKITEVMCDPFSGFFPDESKIRFSCTCLDDADLCKHVAAALYGVAIRFDEDAKLFFILRGVDPSDLLKQATKDFSSPQAEDISKEDLSDLFQIDLA